MASEWVQIIHPETGGIAEVHQSSLHQHYAAGWRLLADGDVPDEVPDEAPPPVSKAKAAQAAKEAAKAESEEN